MKLAGLVAELTGLQPCTEFVAGLRGIQEKLHQLDEEEGEQAKGELPEAPLGAVEPTHV